MLELRLLGDPILLDGARQVKQPWRTQVALLAYLALARDGVASRSTLASVFWPEVPEDAARRSLRQVLFQLRRSVGAVVESTGDCVRLDARRIEVDAGRFEELLDAGQHRDAVSLYGGDFLAGFALESPPFEEWADRQRARLAARAAAACAALSESAIAQGRWAEARQWAERWVEREPFSGLAVARLMTVRAQTGDRSGALAAYEGFRMRLRDELGVSPGRKVEDLAVRIERSTVLAPVPSAPVYSTAAGAPARPPRQPLPLVGREAEFARLHRAWERARAGEREFLLVTGEAGIGKTRLVQEFAAWAELEGATVLRGRAYQIERGVPYSMLAGVLRCALEAPGLAGMDAASLGELSRIVPDFATRFRGVAAPPPADLDTGWVRLLEALRLLFENLAFEAPVLLLLDDLAWADEATLAAVHYLWRALDDLPLLVLATARGVGAPAEEPLQRMLGSMLRDSPARVDQFTLEPLGVESLAHLAAEVGLALPGEASAAALREETGGNPLFVGEALRARLEGSASAASPTVRAVISERVTGLTPAARELLRAAAVLGRRFPFPFAAAVAALPPHESIDALEELLARRLLQQVGYEYDFLHDVVRETVYEGLGSERRGLLHRLALERLRPEAGAAEGLERASALAMHALRGGLPDEARHWLLRSAELARQCFAGNAAERYLEQALATTDSNSDAVAERAAILEQLGDVRFSQSRFADAALTYRDVVATCAPASPSRLRLRIKLLDASLRADLLDLACAEEAVHALAQDAESAGPAYLRDVHVVLANAHLRGGNFQSGETHARQAVAAARTAPDPAARVRALLLRAQAATLRRSPDEVLTVLQEAVRLAAAHRLERELCDAETDYATELCRQTRWDEAIELWDGVILRGERSGLMGTVTVASVNLADVLLRRGAWEPAAAHLDRAEELARRFSFPHVLADVLVNRALQHWLRDEPHALTDAAATALDYALRQRIAAAERNARALQLLGLLALGREAEAHSARDALVRMRSVTHPTWSDDREPSAIARARYEARRGDRAAAITLLNEALDDSGDPYAAAMLQLELADLLREHDPGQARRLAHQARSCAARLGAEPLLQRAAAAASGS